jgi:hypothetical protein
MIMVNLIRLKHGNTKIDTLLKNYKTVEKVKQNSKHRYFLFRGSKKEVKYYLSKIQNMVKQYPKRMNKEKKCTN